MPKQFYVAEDSAYLAVKGEDATTSIKCLDLRDRQTLVEAAHALNHHEPLRTLLADVATYLVNNPSGSEGDGAAEQDILRRIDKTLLESKT